MISFATMAIRYRRTERQVYRHVAGEHLLVDTHSKSATPFFALTPTAVPLWQALAEWQSAADLAERLRTAYGIPAPDAEADAREFLAQLEEIGAVAREETES